MAIVYRALQINLDRQVAIKVISTADLEHAAALGRFEAEAQNVARLHHQNIVAVYDFDVDVATGKPYLVMEWIDGAPLDHHLVNRSALAIPYSLDEAGAFVTEMAHALEYAHDHGVLHLDIKPANIMRANEGRYILMDFGVARIVGQEFAPGQPTLMGTPDYLAPEQITGGNVDPRSDLYALGLVLYELLTGHRPFEDASEPRAFMRRISLSPPDCRIYRPDLPPAVANFLSRALALDPDNRWSTAKEFLIGFEEALVTSAVGASISMSFSASLPTEPIAGLADTSHIPEPSLPLPLPTLIGREEELERYEEALRDHHIAPIFGMPGLGKRTIAATLIHRHTSPGKLFWHRFTPSDSVMGLLWRFAEFAVRLGRPELLHQLQTSLLPGGSAPPVTILLDYVFQQLIRPGYVLGLEDFHFVEDDPFLNDLLERLLPAAEAGLVDIVLVSRSRPDFVNPDVRPLEGLARKHILSILESRGLKLSEELVDQLHAATNGNTHLILVAADLLSRVPDPALQIRHLTDSDQIERFIIRQIDGELSELERLVLQAVALFQGDLASRSGVVAALDGESVRRPLSELTRRSLLQVVDRDGERAYQMMELLRVYFYDMIHRHERTRMHQRVAAYFSGQSDALGVATHLLLSGDPVLALDALENRVWPLLNQGRARELIELLRRFSPTSITDRAWRRVLIAKGETAAFLGDIEQGREGFDEALRDCHDSDLVIRASLGLGWLLKHQSPREAASILTRGLEVARQVDSPQTPWVLIRLGIVEDILRNSSRASELLQEGVGLLNEGQVNWRATAFTNLGIIEANAGRLPQALAQFQSALALYDETGNTWGKIGVWHNLAMVNEQLGDGNAALRFYLDEQAAAVALGSRAKEFNALLGLGALYCKRAEWPLAERALLGAVANARLRGDTGDLVFVLPLLAGLYIDTGRWAVASTWLEEAEAVARASDERTPLPEIIRNWAKWHLAQERTDTAMQKIEESIALATELDLPLEQGHSLRILAMIQLVQGNSEGASESLKRSLAVLSETDAYEAARTLLAIWRLDPDKGGETLLHSARQAIEKLGFVGDIQTLPV